MSSISPDLQSAEKNVNDFLKGGLKCFFWTGVDSFLCVIRIFLCKELSVAHDETDEARFSRGLCHMKCNVKLIVTKCEGSM